MTKKIESTPDDGPVNAFATTLAQLGKGNNLAELSSELCRLVQCVRATGKGGKLTYTLHVEPVKNTDASQVILTDSIKVATPSPDRKASLFFTTEDGGLTRKDPNQSDWIEEQERLAEEAAKAAPKHHGAITAADLKASTAAR